MALIKICEEKSHLRLEFYAPDSANALSLTAARELAEAAKIYKSWNKPVVVTSGHPRVFCSGGNLTDYKKLKKKAEGLKVNREITAALDSFAKWPAPKLAVVEGDVLGGGMEWLACFDFRWSTPGAAFAFWQKRIGLSTGWGGGTRWANRISQDQVRKLLIEARILPAEGALRLGLVDAVFPQWKIRAQASMWAADLSCEILNRLTSWSPKSEAKLFGELWLGTEHEKFLASWTRSK